VPDHVKGTGRPARIEAAVALVDRAICLAESEGRLDAAFAGDRARPFVRFARESRVTPPPRLAFPCVLHVIHMPANYM